MVKREQLAEIWKLKRAGHSQAEIGRRVGLTPLTIAACIGKPTPSEAARQRAVRDKWPEARCLPICPDCSNQLPELQWVLGQREIELHCLKCDNSWFFRRRRPKPTLPALSPPPPPAMLSLPAAALPSKPPALPIPPPPLTIAEKLERANRMCACGHTGTLHDGPVCRMCATRTVKCLEFREKR